MAVVSWRRLKSARAAAFIGFIACKLVAIYLLPAVLSRFGNWVSLNLCVTSIVLPLGVMMNAILYRRLGSLPLRHAVGLILVSIVLFAIIAGAVA